MASSFGTKLCDYHKLRFRMMDKGKGKTSTPPLEQTWKDFRRQWIVLNVALCPTDCYITYYAKEEHWLSNQPVACKLSLNNFKLIMNDMNSKSKDHLEIEFEQYAIFLNFVSITKQQQWYDELERIKCRTYAEMVRCIQHPEREAEYVMEVFPDRLKFWHPQKQVVSFEWKLQFVRRVQYHNKTGKVEIEVGRATETGEGKFYFIGLEIKSMFYKLRENIMLLSKTSTLKKSHSKQSSSATPEALNLLVQSLTDEDSSGGNTGGTDDGTSGDSPLFSSMSHTPPPPPYPPAKTSSELNDLLTSLSTTTDTSTEYQALNEATRKSFGYYEDLRCTKQ